MNKLGIDLFNITWIVDKELFLKFNPDIQDKLKKRAKQSLDKHTDDIELILNFVKIFLYNCFYCRKFYIEFVPDFNGWFVDRCPFCGEVSPYYQFNENLKKTKCLIEIAENNINVSNKVDGGKNRVLLEQSIVTLATGVEIYLRNIYAIILNIRYVKDNRSLFNRFLKDGRNEFTNIDKANKRFKGDLQINLNKEILEDKHFKKLNLLMCKRNVIVHNSGIIDQSFLKCSKLTLKKGEEVPLDWKEIKEYIKTMKFLRKKCDALFENDIQIDLLVRAEKEIAKKYY